MKYRKKPVIIDAEPYHKGLEDGFLICDNCPDNREDNCSKCNGAIPYIETLEGKMKICQSDYIITGIKGERYPCKKDIFLESYEPVEERR